MLKIESNVVINRPVEEVFEVLSNHENYPKWNPPVIEVKKTSTGPIGLGTTWRSVSHRLGKRHETESEIIEYEPNRKVTRRHTHGMPVKDHLSFESVGGGTRVAETIEAEPGGFFRLTTLLLIPVMRRQLGRSLANLKELMEAHSL